MMAPTHVAIGLVLAAALSTVVPEYATAIVVGSVVGSLVPDVDMVVGTHRRTLHAPVLAWVPAAALTGLAWVLTSSVTVGAAVAAVAIAVHSAVDVAGAGEEIRPWERTNPDAVYNHALGRWHRARYWIRYDGAPEDAVLTLSLLGAAVWVLRDSAPLVVPVAAVAAVVAVVYAALRKQMAEYVGPLVK